ncbi:MAG: N-6 DNA methylase [Bacteroidia bacterium]|nr:N-6 DNA methylase [Bacteroidia bacterium]
MTPESAKKELAKLIADYEEHRDQYFEKGYDEIKFRNNIVNRFFKILGWDVDNIENLPEYNRDVIIHFKLKTKKSTTKPDYAFGLLAELKPLFFVEAKTPATFIKDHKDSAHQIRRYGRSAWLAVSILTNFEEFAVYDCTQPIKQNEPAGVRRIEYFTYSEYLDEKKFEVLWNFSKEAVRKGKFDKYIQTDTQKKGSVPLDKEFIEKLNEWREYLATSIKLNNKHLTEEDINYAVQLIIDRIIFLRFCEDINIEYFGNLQDAAIKGITHQNLIELYHKADEKYNSGLFDFAKDTITPKLKIDNKILKNIITELYRPNTEYEYGVMPVEILGNAYEQFLGHIIKITPSGKARVVPKPEVKKAGGVFYTPQYIVEYIVDNTVGKLIKGKTPEQISKIKIVDPACGSGSFLLGAFICLLKYHSEYYWKKGLHKKKSKNSPLTPEGKLTVAEKKRILLNNLYGVDIDPNAVEVTKLSLLLKTMDGETKESIYLQLKIFHERALPDLDDNIKCGNSLIGYDYNGDFLELNKEERKNIEKKLKFFDWKTAFSEVFKQGGFDAVIGNPPYVQMAMYEWFDDEQKMYLLNKYCSSMGRMNTFGFFIEKGINLLIKDGKLGYIIPNTILTQEYYQELRSLILKTTHIDNIVSYEKLVFVDAVVETTTLILSKPVSKAKTKISFCDKDLNYTEKSIHQETFNRTHKNQFSVSYDELDTQVKSRIERHCKLTFNDIGEINQAIALKSDRTA